MLDRSNAMQSISLFSTKKKSKKGPLVRRRCLTALIKSTLKTIQTTTIILTNKGGVKLVFAIHRHSVETLPGKMRHHRRRR
mmetsp:Transcript_11963/g.17702  ORF Transcript_11963/g.17702 Transcript_11963/m.17702 type:complete len:81 (-) Transcript_11963:91-333(-)